MRYVVCWRHRPTNYVWAFELVNERLTRVAGPVEDLDTMAEMIGYLRFSDRDIEWITAEQDDFERVLPTECSGEAAAICPHRAVCSRLQ
jgi:hypothetical protein